MVIHDDAVALVRHVATIEAQRVGGGEAAVPGRQIHDRIGQIGGVTVFQVPIAPSLLAELVLVQIAMFLAIEKIAACRGTEAILETLLAKIVREPLDTGIGTDDDGGFNARQGTYVISLINFLSAATSVWTINTFGRRILLLIGHALMAFIHVGIGFAIIFDKNALVLIGICAFLFAYQNTSGPIAY